MKLIELLRLRGIDANKSKIKVVRHEDKRVNVHEFSRKELEIYQNHQGKRVFDGVDYIASFIGEERGLAKLLGVYRVNTPNAIRPPRPSTLSPALRRSIRTAHFYYDLRAVSNFRDLEDRLVVKWTGGYINWVQELLPPKDKPVVQILPEGREKAFSQYGDVLLTYGELCRIVRYPDANADWHTALSSTAGVYLIVDRISGRLYIGSASGHQGILGRWRQYVKNGHGGNKKLKVLLEQRPNREKHFQYCILRTLSRSLTRGEVVTVEQEFKKKFGKIACALN
jgi:hypothetical protein